MRSLRTALAGIAVSVLLTVPGLPVAGQEGAVSEDVLFEVVVPASAVPDPFKTLYFEAQTVDPGADAVVGADAENMTGRGIYVDSGELIVEPVTDAYLWRQEATLGADPEGVVAGVPVRLTAGDLLLLPTIPDTEAVGDVVLRVANPGAEMAVTYGFHLCGGGGSPAWPEGMGHISPAGGIRVSGRDLAPLASEDAVVRLTRLTFEPGAVTGLDEDVLFGLFRREAGTIDVSLGTDWELRSDSDVPASMLYLSGVEVPAPAE